MIKITAELITSTPYGTPIYVEDSASLTLIPTSMSNPPVLNLNVSSSGDMVDLYVSLDSNDASGLPADVYLWLECTKVSITDDITGGWIAQKCIWVNSYPFGLDIYPQGQCNTQNIDPFSPEAPPDIFYPELTNEITPVLTNWTITDIPQVMLTRFPTTSLPSDYSCKVKSILQIRTWDGWIYNVYSKSNLF